MRNDSSILGLGFDVLNVLHEGYSTEVFASHDSVVLSTVFSSSMCSTSPIGKSMPKNLKYAQITWRVAYSSNLCKNGRRNQVANNRCSYSALCVAVSSYLVVGKRSVALLTNVLER